MSIRARLTGHLLGRSFVLFLALGLVFIAWGVGAAIFLTATSRPADKVAGTSPIQTLEALRDATTVASGTVSIGPDALARVEKAKGWVQVLDAQGRVIYAHAVPSRVPTAYAPGELVYLRNKPAEVGQRSIYTLYASNRGKLTWVLGSTKGWVAPINTAASTTQLVQALVALVVVSIGVALLVAWASAETLSRPLVHILSWLEALANGDYAEPLDKNGRPASRHIDGSLRAPFRTYREVIASLDSLTAELGRTQAERERLEAAREEWITGITHDLRTPLSSVRGYADLLGSDYDFAPAEVREHARTIGRQAENMERLIDDLGLTFRLRAEALPLRPEPLDLTALAREAAVALANDPRAEGRDVAFEDSAAGGGPLTVVADPAYLARALGNLLGNAAVHNPAGTTVTVRTLREPGFARVEVSDDGVGMDEATRDRLFDRYYRGTASGADASGTGLGMAIARQLVEAQGGTIAVTSAPGAGTTISVRLPLA